MSMTFREKVELNLPNFLPDDYEGMKSLCASLTGLLHEACDIIEDKNESTDILSKAARKAATTGNIKDLHKYLELRRNIL